MREQDFILRGYNKYHLWTHLYYEEMINPRNQNLSRKEIKNRALYWYLRLLGYKHDETMQ